MIGNTRKELNYKIRGRCKKVDICINYMSIAQHNHFIDVYGDRKYDERYKNWLLSWFCDKELSTGVDVIGWNFLKKIMQFMMFITPIWLNTFYFYFKITFNMGWNCRKKLYISLEGNRLPPNEFRKVINKRK